MSATNNLLLFLANYLRTRNIEWLELFIFEYHQRRERSDELCIQGNDQFVDLSFHMSYHLLKLLFSAICDLLNDTGDKRESLRHFLTNGLGSRIITMMSIEDLDLSNVTNERELVNVLTKIFPTERWDSDLKQSSLSLLTRDDIKKVYKSLWLLDPTRNCDNELKVRKKSSQVILPEYEKDNGKSYEEFITAEFNNRQETMQLTTSQLARNIIVILRKLVEIEETSVLGQTDQNSVTMSCLNFSLDILGLLHEQTIFNEDDQSVIKVNLMELTFLCFNNLVNRDGKSIEPVFKKLFNLLELSDNNELSCGLILNILAVMNNMCVKKSIQKTEILTTFALCNHLILKRMEILSRDKELLHAVQLLLIRIIKNVRSAHRLRFCDKKRPRKKIRHDFESHHDAFSDACTFERLLIESLPLIRSYANLKKLLNYFRSEGICCCNGSIATLTVFLRPTTVPSQHFSFIQEKVIRPMFDKSKICIFCSDKIKSENFQNEFFGLLSCELRRRHGWELHSLLHHLTNIQKMFAANFLRNFIFKVIVPTFEGEKSKFIRNPDDNFESKLIVTCCLNLLNESMREEAIVTQFFDSKMIHHIKSCTLIPSMATSACQLLKHAIDNIKIIGDNEDERENLMKLVNTILFSNVLFLTKELMEIYDQIDLPKDVPIAVDNDISDKALDKSADESADFEILDEKTVDVKEELTHLDVLLLNTIHWNILCDLITKDPSFQQEFVANIFNNFDGNILFTIAYNALNSILLKKELKSFQLRVISPEPRMLSDDAPVIFDRCDHLSPVVILNYDVSYKKTVDRFYQLYERGKSFHDRLRETDGCSLLYRIRSDSNAKFLALVHKDVFLTDNVSDNPTRTQQIAADDHFYSYHNLLNHIWIGIFEGKAIRDRFIKIINRFVRQEEELKAIHRANVIKEITGRCGVKYMSSIARNCFDICWRLSDNISFTSKMSTALDELKLLLLQDNWDENKEAMVDTLQLLLGVAEMKTRSVSRMMFMDPENHLSQSTESMFSEYFSTVECENVQNRSDDESSSDKKTSETFYSADECYDADVEYGSTQADTESSQSFSLGSVPIIHGFRNTNEHICKLVVEVLMDLSRRCVEKPEQWQPEVLISLVQRLSCMKTYLGGSEFLLKGFSTILQSRKTSLKALQTTVLNLIEDLNSPEALNAFLSILTVSDAAVELIMSRLQTLCNNDAAPRPFTEVNYPTFSSESLVNSTCDSHLHRLISSFKDVHSSNQLLTPFTESAQMIPLNYMDFKPWNSQGFTVAAWIHMPTNSDDKLATHLMSLGSEKLMMAIYVNCDGCFTVSIIKPNQNLSKASKVHPTTSAANKENVNHTNVFGIALATLGNPEQPRIRTRGFLKNGTKKRDDENVRRLQTSKISVNSKRLKLRCDRWMHVCFSARNSDTQIMLLITMNGTEQELIEIPIDGMVEPDVNGVLQLLCIGSQRDPKDELTSLKYSMSTVMLFGSPLESPPQTSHLFSLGPDCDSLIDCEAIRINSLPGLVDFSKLGKAIARVGQDELSARLKANVIAIYSAGKPRAAVGFKNGDHGKSLEMFIVGKIPEPAPVASLARSVQFCGGLSTLLFLFARVVELTEDPETQSTALYVFLKVAHSNNHLYSEFEQKSLFNLIAHVFKHSSCYNGPGMLKAILDVIYGGTMFNRRSSADDYQINEHSELNIQNPKLLLTLLENFCIFQSPEVLDLLFKSLMVVVRETHPHKVFIRQCLTDHDFYAKLIEFCKIHLANSANAIPISATTALLIVELLKMLSKDPPVIWSMSELQKLLLLMHHPSESFVTHDRSKFYFSLSGNKPLKSSRLSLGSSSNSKYFNFSIKIRSTNATPLSPKSPSSPPRTPRTYHESTSLNQEMSTSSRSLRSSIVSPLHKKIKSRKFDELAEGQTTSVVKALKDLKTRKDMKTKRKGHVRRLSHTPKKSPFRKMKTPNKKANDKRVLTPDDQEMLETFKTLMTAGSVSSIISDVDANRYETGISVLQEHLFVMLRDSVMLLDDQKAEQELPECLRIEMLILFANHHDGNVRSAIIDLIHEITNRLSKETIGRYEKTNIWIHLANQLTISRANMKMAQACASWICGKKVSLQDVSRAQDIQVVFKPALGVLIAMLPSIVHEAQAMSCTTKFLRLILETNPDCLTSSMLSSLITSSIKALVKVDRHQERVKDSILMVLEQIAVKSLTSSGSIQNLWEILYGLAFVERQKKREVIREAHVMILKQLISLCLTEQSRRSSRAGDITQPMMVVVQALGTLPSSEIKTRFHIIHDRAVLFVISWDPEDELLACEIEFVKFLISLTFSGINQGSNLLLWALHPRGSDELKSFIVQKLSDALDYDTKFVIPGSDPKLVKSLILEHLNTIESSSSDDSLRTLTKFCGTSVQHQGWNWSMSAVEKIESNRQSSLKDQNSTTDKIVYKMESTVQLCIDSAMKMTRNVIDVQNKERRHLMNQLKKSQEMDFYREWFDLIQRMIHENAAWYSDELYPSTWELDETEGPGRMRIRFKRSVLQIEERFFVKEFRHKASYQHRKPLLNFLLRPKEAEKYSIRDQVVFTFNGKHLTMEMEVEGEIIITDHQLIFLANVDTYVNSILCDVKGISEVWDRRYQHKEVALEVFLSTQKTFFIIFESNYERDIVRKFISDKIDRRKPDDYVSRWIDGRSTNYEYLIELNKAAGRTYNDLMQYPVFPWILRDYESDVLNLKSPDVYRKLSKTISTQYEEMEEHYVTNYKYLAQSLADQPTIMKPYHYSSHYSNSGTILHFLVRVPPFTSMFLLYQDHNFDIPDRTFHSMATTFRLTSKESATDVKELTPEFFHLPDLFENTEGFNFGKRQSGELVNDVKLPAWSEGSSRIFMLVHRQALESSVVRKQLHQWIDLIFGFKQKGNAAINAINVFHPATYPEFQITNITDLVERQAYETMIRTYGQMPRQIFTTPHKKSNASNDNSTETRQVLKTVKGLRWGVYTGSPQLPKPRKIDSLRCSSRLSRLVLVHDSNMFYGLPDKCHLMRAAKVEHHDLVLWGEKDGIVRVKSLKDPEVPTRKLFHIPAADPVTACGSHLNYTNLWFGHESGNISVFVRSDEKLPVVRKEKKPRPLNDALETIIGIKEINAVSNHEEEEVNVESKWNFPIVLVKHRGKIVDIKVCVEFKIVVSIGSDSRTVIWDAQKIEYIRTIEPSCNTLKSQLSFVEVSPTLGDILTVFSPRPGTEIATDDGEVLELSENSGDEDFINVSMAIAGKSQLRLNSINAKYINHTLADGFVTSICFSFIKEGIGVNAIAVGFDDGFIRLYSTWTLELIRDIATGVYCEISEIIFTTNHHLAFLADQEIQVWESEGVTGEPPKLNSIVLF